MPVESSKICFKCKKLKAFQEFWKHGKRKLQSRCKVCIREDMRDYRKNFPEQHAANCRKSRYGISRKDYEILMKQQKDVCAICKRKDRHKKFLSVDHCHKTGKIRGLLCSSCNVGIGRLEDSTKLLKAALRYLKNF